MITTGHDFNSALQRLGFIGMRQFRSLPAEGQAEIHRQFRRHLAACGKLGIDADPHFLPEAISEQKRVPINA